MISVAGLSALGNQTDIPRQSQTALTMGVSEGREASLFDLYKFSYFLALRALSWRHAKSVARLLLEPCNYWRNVEVPAVLNHLRVQPRERVLDIGSPKLPSLFVWHRLGAEVHATDLYPYFVREYSHYLRRLSRSSNAAKYFIELQDARALGYPDAYFDKVYAISVLEHIEDDGDSRAMREISRVLKPGGLCCLTVPFAQSYYESTIDYELYYKKPVQGTPVFYERHYDTEALERRLIEPSGLRFAATEFYGERWFPYQRFHDSLPRGLKVLFAVGAPLFSRLFLYKTDGDRTAAAKTALLVLQKEALPGAVRP